MDKGGARRGRKSKVGALRKDEGPQASELVNGGSGKEKLDNTEVCCHLFHYLLFDSFEPVM